MIRREKNASVSVLSIVADSKKYHRYFFGGKAFIWISCENIFITYLLSSETGKLLISSRITSVAGLPVCSQYFSSFSASCVARLTVMRLTAHFLFVIIMLFAVYFRSSKESNKRGGRSHYQNLSQETSNIINIKNVCFVKGFIIF